MATPLPVSKPAIILPKLIILFRYNSVIMTLDAQFGINPIRDVMNGAKRLSFSNKVDRYSLPK